MYWGGDIPLHSRLGLMECRSFPSGVWGRAGVKNDFGAFYTQNAALVNRILLNVTKCCVIELLK